MKPHSTSAPPTPKGKGCRKRSAPVLDTRARGESLQSSAAGACFSEAHCAFCANRMVRHRRTRLYCSGRCRAAASLARRVRREAERDRLRAIYAGLTPEDRAAFAAEVRAGDPLARVVAELLGVEGTT
jgi:hypothetical protein